eukprot:Transcript_17234.p1 GENE.Transcript_17234~~Transcript_17234.p1  ORF type:complete len:344 (+),score=101.81 Transcript_17234:48-1034(+)
MERERRDEDSDSGERRRRRRRDRGRRRDDSSDEDSDSGERRKARRRHRRREEGSSSDGDGGRRRRRHRDRGRRRSRSRSRSPDGRGRRDREPTGADHRTRERFDNPEEARARPPAAEEPPARKRVSKWDVPEGAPGADMAVTYREAVAAGTLLQPGESRPSMLNPVDAAKQARRIYVGNVPPETPPAEVVAFLNLTMRQAELTKFPAPIQAVHQGNTFIFVELPDATEASELLKCDGALFKGSHLKLRRPTNSARQERPASAGFGPQGLALAGAPTTFAPAPPGIAAPLDLQPDPLYDQQAHQLGMTRTHIRPSYNDVKARFAARLNE